MGGEIWVESKLGKGSTFFVTLHSEIAEAPSDLSENRESSVGIYPDERPTKVLIAEDNELNAEILIEILECEGFEVVHAPNGQVAVDIFGASEIGEIQIILMDLQMPVMDGCTAAMEIRKMKRPDAKTISIFACTANNFNEDRERAEKSGMNDFLSKPIDVAELLKKLGGSVPTK
jgi:CheY-like chemotaxis protein